MDIIRFSKNLKSENNSDMDSEYCKKEQKNPHRKKCTFDSSIRALGIC